jgi:hypothetical protein
VEPSENTDGSISLVIEAAYALSSPTAHQRLRAVGGDPARVWRVTYQGDVLPFLGVALIFGSSTRRFGRSRRS